MSPRSFDGTDHLAADTGGGRRPALGNGPGRPGGPPVHQVHGIIASMGPAVGGRRSRSPWSGVHRSTATPWNGAPRTSSRPTLPRAPSGPRARALEMRAGHTKTWEPFRVPTRPSPSGSAKLFVGAVPSHWSSREGKVSNCRPYPPTPWNASVRDQSGTPGPLVDDPGTRIFEKSSQGELQGMNAACGPSAASTMLPCSMHMYLGKDHLTTRSASPAIRPLLPVGLRCRAGAGTCARSATGSRHSSTRSRRSPMTQRVCTGRLVGLLVNLYRARIRADWTRSRPGQSARASGSSPTHQQPLHNHLFMSLRSRSTSMTRSNRRSTSSALPRCACRVGVDYLGVDDQGHRPSQAGRQLRGMRLVSGHRRARRGTRDPRPRLEVGAGWTIEGSPRASPCRPCVVAQPLSIRRSAEEGPASGDGWMVLEDDLALSPGAHGPPRSRWGRVLLANVQARCSPTSMPAARARASLDAGELEGRQLRCPACEEDRSTCVFAGRGVDTPGGAPATATAPDPSAAIGTWPCRCGPTHSPQPDGDFRRGATVRQTRVTLTPGEAFLHTCWRGFRIEGARRTSRRVVRDVLCRASRRGPLPRREPGEPQLALHVSRLLPVVHP